TSLYQHRFKAMGCPCELRFLPADDNPGESQAQLLEAEIRRLEQAYSRYQKNSIVNRINVSAGSGRSVQVDHETAALLDYAATCFEQSGGLFDITSGVLRKVWDFKNFQTPIGVPEPDQLAQVLNKVGWQKLVWKAPQLKLPVPGMEIDLGGLVKEYAADSCARIARTMGIRHGIVDLGGDVSIIGPQPDGTAWQIGIRNPAAPTQAVAEIDLSTGGLATSGDYERFLEIDGQRYSHILNPLTGWPVRGLASVSVVAPHCLVAGTTSTIAMLKGMAGKQWLDDLGLPNIRIDSQGAVSGTIV
ncbi:MAG: FAD:protein FMN transferase, partial [Pseudohongiellaceae bacterium]